VRERVTVTVMERDTIRKVERRIIRRFKGDRWGGGGGGGLGGPSERSEGLGVVGFGYVASTESVAVASTAPKMCPTFVVLNSKV